MIQSLDNTRERLKTSDQDTQGQLSFPDIMPKDAGSIVSSKLDDARATQALVDKKILAPITLVQDGSKGNPLRTQKGKKKRTRKIREFSKFDDEILKLIPEEKLAQLLEGQTDAFDSLPEDMKKLVRELMQDLLDEEQSDPHEQKEVVSTALPASLPGASTGTPLAAAT